MEQLGAVNARFDAVLEDGLPLHRVSYALPEKGQHVHEVLMGLSLMLHQKVPKDGEAILGAVRISRATGELSLCGLDGVCMWGSSVASPGQPFTIQA